MHNKGKHPGRHILFLSLALAGGIICTRIFRFTLPVLNYIFVTAVLSIPFLALRPLSQLRKIPKVIGLVLVSPVLIVVPLLAMLVATCNPAIELHHYNKD